MSNGFNYDTREIIFGLKSKVGRRDETIAVLEDRVAVLEGIVQANADDRDGYMQRCVELEDERDRARRVAVELEQQLAVAENAIESAYQEATDEMRVINQRMDRRQHIDSIHFGRVKTELRCVERIRTTFLDRAHPDVGRAA